MKKIILKLITFLFVPLYGRKKFQSLFGVLFNISLRGLNYRNDNGFQNGEYDMIRRISAHYKKEALKQILVFDVGAHVGSYTKVIQETFEHARLDFVVYCFEPMPAAFRILQEQFGNDQRIKPFNLGLGKEPGTAIIHSNHDQSKLASLYKKDMNYAAITMSVTTEIRVENLDHFCTSNQIGKIHFLKIDTEGGEFEIMNNAQSTVRQVDFIQFEYGTSNVDSRTYIKDFFELLSPDFKIYRLLKDGMYELKKYHPDYEIMVLSNYLAVSKRITDFPI